MVETLLILFFFGGVAVLIIPIALLVKQGGKLRTLEAAVAKLTARLAALETREGVRAPPIAKPTKQSAPFVPVPHPQVAAQSIPPPLPTTPPPKPAAPKIPVAAIDWENFLGVKLFAWLGGFVLFLGVVFLVKYSFENNLITPQMRVIMGLVIGLGLIAGGWFTSLRNYSVPGQSLCATGVLVLYASIFGAHAFYNLISLTSAFLIMSLITVGAFLLAVKLDAQVIVVLGLVGGFCTPPLLASGVDRPGLLFGYVALLNTGIAAVALRKQWDYLLVLAAIGTVIMETGWIPVTDPGRASAGFLIFLGLQAQFLAFAFFRQKQEPPAKWSTPAALAVGFSSIVFGFYLLSLTAFADRSGFLFGYIFLADIGLLALALMRSNPAGIAASAGIVVFVWLSFWTSALLTPARLWWALGAYFLFAVIHAGFSVWPARIGAGRRKLELPSYTPLLALVLLLFCVGQGQTSFAVWFCVLLVDLIAVALAWRLSSLKALVIALVTTLVTAGVWIASEPPLDADLVSILVVIGGFGVFFAAAATFLARSLGAGSEQSRRNVPALAAALPFVLLLMLIAKLPVPDPTLVFAVALLLAVVLLGLGILARTSWIALVALAFTWAVEREWHALHFQDSAALLPLGWYVAFFLVFAAYPFFAGGTRAVASSLDGTAAVPPLPWAMGALSGVLHFWLIDELIASAYPHLRNGFLPALFVLPYAFGVFHLVRKCGVAPASGDARLAWQGAAALLFISLIFPLQFQREWITLGWAVEGLALLLLFRSVPNQWLRIVGAGLLCTAFVRLALNPAVLEYHPRAGTRIWNWYLYAYGITSLCLFAGAHAIRNYRETQLARVLPRLLYTLGAILVFLLLNIEIADYFSVGPTLTFSFSGDFARDMTYSIAWALFAFALLLVGMRQKTKWVRYAGLALLFVTLAKLFLHDFANLGQLYLIGAFIGVALILILASFVYQRFLRPAANEEGE